MSKSAPPEIIQRIMIDAGSGRLGAAALSAGRAHADFPEDARLAALAGAVELKRGQFARAVELLRQAHLGFPDDIRIRSNLAESQYHTGDLEAAAALCSDDAIARDTGGNLIRLAAFFAQEREDFSRAASLYRQIVGVQDDDWSSWNNLGNALGGLEDHQGAIAALKRAAALAPDSGPVMINLANAMVAGGDIEGAERLLRESSEAAPEDAAPLLSLFAIYRDQGREDEAYAAIAEAARRSPSVAAVRSDYGQEAAKRHDYDIAEREFEAALELDPLLGPSYVGLGSLYERMNREDQLDPLIARARQMGTDSQSIAYIQALLHKRASDFDAAVESLDLSGDVVVPGRKFHLRGVMLDRLKRHEEAFSAFQAMNEHWQQDPSQPRARAGMYRDAVAHDTALVDREWIAGWTPPPPPDNWPTPVFLVGFPRSGTTLLDTMLMREPRALVLEEEPFLTDLEIRSGGIGALPQLNAAALAEGRRYYFEQVGKLGQVEPDTFVVDKHPLHLNKVSVIQRFFPDARYILALRHPCDVLLSCYLTNFRINNAMSNFLDLGDAAALYDLTFTHWEKARSVFDLPVFTIVYERLVEDTPRELRPLFDWLGLAWPGDELDHREAARARGVVHTASYAQVTEPIYKRAAGRWHRYAHHLEPVYDRMRPWVERFGYSLEDGMIPSWPSTNEGVG